MNKNGKFRRRRDRIRTAGPSKVSPAARSGRDILRQEEHFKIAPKHPGMGRR